jgi:hypothetical protein
MYESPTWNFPPSSNPGGCFTGFIFSMRHASTPGREPAPANSSAADMSRETWGAGIENGEAREENG